MKIGLLIPCLNGSCHLAELASRIVPYMDADSILLVDDGSSDDSATRAQKLGWQTLVHSHNKGKGAAIQSGLNYFIQNQYDAVILMDVDLQHPPEKIPEFVEQLHSSDLVLGVRDFSSPTMPFPRVCSNWLTSQIVSWLAQEKIPDSQCGYRALRISLARQLVLQTERYQTETEMIFAAAKLQARFAFVQIPVIYQDEISYISHHRDISNFVSLCWEEIKKKFKNLV